MESLLIGTLFEEDEIDTKQNFYTQIARDHLGHKRFHGVRLKLGLHWRILSRLQKHGGFQGRFPTQIL